MRLIMSALEQNIIFHSPSSIFMLYCWVYAVLTDFSEPNACECQVNTEETPPSFKYIEA